MTTDHGRGSVPPKETNWLTVPAAAGFWGRAVRKHSAEFLMLNFNKANLKIMTILESNQQSNAFSASSEGDNSIIIQKKTTGVFVLTELCIYASQILMFFFVAVLTSNLLRDEAPLVNFLTAKIGSSYKYEIIGTMLAILLTLGVIGAIAKALPTSSLLQRLADEVLAEAPRTIYVFSSGVAGTLCAVTIFIANNPSTAKQPPTFWLLMAFFIAVVGFAYGCIFSYAFKHKEHIISVAKNNDSNVL